MPLIEVNQIRRVTANVRFDDAIVVQINQYAAFIKASPDEVINKGLEYLFSKDRDFAAFRATDDSKQVPALLRPRKTAAPVAPKTAVETADSVKAQRA